MVRGLLIYTNAWTSNDWTELNQKLSNAGIVEANIISIETVKERVNQDIGCNVREETLLRIWYRE